MTQLDPEVEATVAEWLKKTNAFASGEFHACPTCGAQIETIILYEKLEPEMYSLYTQPCNHRHGLWKGAPDWAVNAGIVYVIPLEVDDDETYLDSDDDLDDDFDDDYEPADDTFFYEIITLEHSRKGQAYVLHIHMESREDGTDEWENYRWKQKLKDLPDHHRQVCIALAKAGKWGEELTEHFGRADDAQFDHNEFRRESTPADEIPFYGRRTRIMENDNERTNVASYPKDTAKRIGIATRRCCETSCGCAHHLSV